MTAKPNLQKLVQSVVLKIAKSILKYKMMNFSCVKLDGISASMLRTIIRNSDRTHITTAQFTSR